MSKYNKIAIVSSGLLPLERPNAASAFLAGVCEHNGIEYEIFDLNIFLKRKLGQNTWDLLYISATSSFDIQDAVLREQTKQAIDEFISTLEIYNPDLLALTVFSHQQIAITTMLLTQWANRSLVIAGGPGVSYDTGHNVTVGKTWLERGILDYYVLGEGDIVFDSFIKGQHEIGLNSKQYTQESWAVQIDDLDLPIIPSYKKIKFDDYYPLSKHTIGIVGSRGCVRRCTFCDVGNIWKKFRFRSADHIAQEILKHNLDTGVSDFVFLDSLINGSIKQFTELLQNIISLKKQYTSLQNISFSGAFIVRPKGQHPEKLFELMQQAGCHNLYVGIETGSDAVRFHMGKKFTNVDIDHHMEMCSRYGIRNALLMITGYPTETLQDHQDTVTMFKRYQKYLINDTVANVTLHHPYNLLKHTPIDDMKHELGIIVSEENYGTPYWRIESNPELTVKERFRRYIELQRTIVELNYPGTHMDLTSLKQHITNLQEKKELV